ncbi:hypothetical protein QL285_082998 [Trifolium repens]|nr:hypothetical protein QL285_082998 [Trifolium repens]
MSGSGRGKKNVPIQPASSLHRQTRSKPLISQLSQETATFVSGPHSQTMPQPLKKTTIPAPFLQQTMPQPVISKPLQKITTPAPSRQQTMPHVISKPLRETTTPAPSSHPPTRHARTLSQPLQNTSISASSHSHTAPASSHPQTIPTSALSPDFQSGTSMDMTQDPSLDNRSPSNPHVEISSVASENIKWGSKDPSDGRIWIRSAPGNNFEPESTVRGAITKIFKENFLGAWSCWSAVDTTTQDSWFDDFKAKYKWFEKDEDNIRKSFDSRGTLALKNALFKVRSGKDKGEWIDEDKLKELRDEWKGEKWQNISKINTQNRKSQAGHNVHSGGSISAKEHAKRMRVELNREPTCFEVYQRMHKPKEKSNEWFNEEQALIAESYQTKLFERDSQRDEGSSQQSDDSIYMEVVGGINKKGLIFGLGSQAAAIKESLKFLPSISTDVVRPDKVAAMEAKIEALTIELEQKNLEQETLKQKMEHWERIFGRFVSNINQNSPIQLEREGGIENDEMDASENDEIDE